MANETDQRVVELQFNNKQFEANVSQTLKSLDNLKDSLKFEGAERGFDNLERAANRFSADKFVKEIGHAVLKANLLSNTLNGIKNKVLGFATSMISTGSKVVTSFGIISNLGAAWAQYAEKTSSVQTIMAATREELGATGAQMQIVEGELNKLGWFTDETSHKFLDLVNNIGKFTSSNVGLHSAVDEMMGIATWASISGANTTEAGRAMYNLAQAMAMGYVSLNDWKSIENANMATIEFKQTAIDTAVELGRLKKVSEDTYQTIDGNTVTIENFRETLTDSKWFDTKVLEQTLTKYGGFATKLNSLYEGLNANGTVYTSTILDMVDAEKQGIDYTEDFNRTLDATGVSAEVLHSAIQDLASEENDLGYRAFKASQETKTFGEAIDYVNTAVTSGLAQSFETIFGNYADSTSLWTDFADVLYDVFVQSGETRNQVLDLWAAAGGREYLFGVEEGESIVRNLGQAFDDLIGPAKNAWEAVFPPMTTKEIATQLLAFSIWLRDMAEYFKMSEQAAKGLETVLYFLTYPLKILKALLREAAFALVFLAALLFGLINGVLEFIGSLDILNSRFVKFLNEGNKIDKILDQLGVALAMVLIPFARLARMLVNVIISGASLYVSIQQWISGMRDAHPAITWLLSALGSLVGAIIAIPSAIASFLSQFDSFGSFFSYMFEVFKGLGENIVSGLAQGIGGKTGFVISTIVGLFNALKEAFMSIAGIHSPSVVFMAFGIMIVSGLAIGIATKIYELLESGTALGEAIITGFSKAKVVEVLLEMLEGLSNIVEFVASIIGGIAVAIIDGTKRFMEFVNASQQVATAADTAVTSVTNSVSTLETSTSNTLSNFWGAISRVFGKVKGFLEPVNNFFKRFFDNLTAGQIVVLVLTAAMYALSKSLTAFIKELTEAVKPISESIKDIFKSVSGMISNFGNIFKSISKAIDTISEGMTKAFQGLMRAKAFTEYTKGILMIAAALGILSYICRDENIDNIKRAALVLVLLAAGTLVFVGIASAMSIAAKKFTKFSGSIIFLAGAVLVLAIALRMLSDLQFSVGGIIGFLLSCITIVAMIGVINRLCGGVLANGGLGILMVAAAVLQLCKAFGAITEALKDVKSAGQVVALIFSFITIVAGMALLMKVVHGVRWGSGLASFTVFIGMILLIKTVISLMNSVSDMSVGDAWKGLAKSIPTFISVVLYILAMSAALLIGGEAMKGAGLGLLAGVVALWVAFKTFSQMTGDALASAAPGILALILLMGIMFTAIVLIGRIDKLSENIKNLGKTVLAIGAAMLLMVGAFKLMEYVDPSVALTAVGIFGTILLVIGVVLRIADTSEHAAKALDSIRKLIIALAATLVVMSMFTTAEDQGPLIAAALSMLLALIGVAAVMMGLGSITKKVKTGPIIAMIVAVALIGAAILLLSTLDWASVLVASAAMSAALFAFAKAVETISNMHKMKPGKVVAAVILLTMLAGEMALMGYIMYQLADVPWSVIASAALGFSVMVIAMAYACKILANAEGDMLSALGAAGVMIVLAGSLIVAAMALALLDGVDPAAISSGALGLSVMVLAMGQVIKILSTIEGDMPRAISTAALMASLCIALFGSALALKQLDGLGVSTLIFGAISLSAMILAMSIAINILAEINGKISSALAGAAATIILAVSMIEIAFALSVLTGMNISTLIVGTIALGLLMAELAAICIILATAAPQAALAIVGAIAMGVLAIDLIGIAYSLQMLSGMDIAGIFASAVALGLLLAEMAAICVILSAIGPTAALALIGVIAIIALSFDLMIVAAALNMLKDYDFNAIMVNMISLLIIMGVLTGITAILAAVGALAAMAIIGAIAMTILAADLVIIAAAFSLIAQYDMAAIQNAAFMFSLVMGVMLGVVAILGLIGELSAMAIIGAIAMAILAGDMVIIASALATVAQHDPTTIKMAADTMLSVVTSLVGISVLLATVSPAALIGAGVLLSLAVGLSAIGTACQTFALQSATIDQDVQRLVDAITSLGTIDTVGVENVRTAIENLGTAIVDAVSDMCDTVEPEMEKAGEYFVQGIVNGMSDTSGVYAAGYALGDAAWNGLADRLQIHSPSIVGHTGGTMYGLGFTQGAFEMTDLAESGGEALGSAMVSGEESKVEDSRLTGESHAYAFDGGFESLNGAAYSTGQGGASYLNSGAASMRGQSASTGSSLGSALYNAFMAFVNKIKAGLNKLAGAAKGTPFEGVTSKLASALDGFTGGASAAGENGGTGFMNGLINGIKSKYGDAIETAREAVENIKNEFNFEDIMQGIEDQMGNAGGGGAPSGGGGGSPGGGGGSGGSGGSGESAIEEMEEEEDAAANLIVTLDELNDKEKRFAELVSDKTNALKEGRISQEEWNSSIEDSLSGMKIESNWLADLVNRYHEGSIGAEEFNTELQEMNSSIRSQTVREWIAELTAKYREGILTMEEYNARVDKIIDKSEEETRTIEQLNEALQNGTIKLDEYNKARAALATQAAVEAEAARALVLKSQIDLLTDAYNKGELSQEAYEAQVQKLLDIRDDELRSLDELNYSLQAGLIDLDDYASAFGKVVKQNEKAEEQAKEDALRLAILGIGDATEYTSDKFDVYVGKVNSVIDANDRETRSVQELVKALNEGTLAPEAFYAALDKLQSQLNAEEIDALNQKVFDSISSINEQYDKGGMTFDEYVRAVDAVIAQNSRETRSLDELRKAFSDGLISAEEYNRAIAALKEQNDQDAATAKESRTAARIAAIQQQFAEGTLTLEEYNVAIQKVMDESKKETRTVEELNEALRQGAIDSSEYAEAIGNLASQEEAANAAIQAQDVANSIEFLRGRLERNEITLEEYRNLVQSVTEATKKESRTIDDLDRALAKGTITYEEYSEAIRAIYEQEEEYNSKELALNQKVAIYSLRKEYEAGTISQAEYIHQLSLLADKTKEEQRSIKELDYALAHNLITNDEYIEALKTINEQEEARRKAAKDAATASQMDAITAAYKNGQMSLEAYNVAIKRAKENADRETRSIEELRRALQMGIIDVNEFSTAINNLAEQQETDRQRDKDAATASKMETITAAYKNGQMSLEAYNVAIQRAKENADRETRSIEELRNALQMGTIDVNEFSTAIKNLSEQQETDRQRRIDDSIKAQIHNLWVEYEQGAVSEDEYLEGVEKIITLGKRETRTLKELDYQLQNNIITYDEYNTAIKNLYDADNDLTISLKEMAAQEKATGKRSNEFAKLLRKITIDTWGFSDALLDVSTVLRFTGKTFLNFYDMLEENPSLAETFGVTEFINTTDAAVQATEQLMLDFYKMQNPTDLAIQEIESYGDIATEVLEDLQKAWVDYVGTAYNAIMGNYDVFNAPGWFEKEILSPDKLLENQDMYIEGERSFVEKMEDLAGRLDSEMWMSLYEGGSQNLEQVIAFWQMTDAELDAFNAGQERLRTYAKENAEKLAAISVMVYGDAGYEAIQAFVDGTGEAVDIPKIERQAEKIGQEIGDTVGEAMAENVGIKFTEDILRMSWGTLLKLFEDGVLSVDEACDIILAKTDEYKDTLYDHSIDESFFTEQGIRYIRAIFNGASELVPEAHESLVTAVTALTPYDEYQAYSTGTNIGQYLDQGIASAVENYIEYAVSAVEKLADAMISKLEEKIKQAQAKLSNIGGAGGGTGIVPMSLSGSTGISTALRSMNSAVANSARFANEVGDKIESALNDFSTKTTTTNNNVTVNQNIDAQPSDAYIIAQETGNTIRGGFRKIK